MSYNKVDFLISKKLFSNNKFTSKQREAVNSQHGVCKLGRNQKLK